MTIFELRNRLAVAVTMVKDGAYNFEELQEFVIEFYNDFEEYCDYKED